MKRRKFLLAAGIPVVMGSAQQRPNKGFVVKANNSRFQEKTLIGGKNPNDIKVSFQDTEGSLSIFTYTGHEKGGPPLHIHPNQDEIFFIIEGEYLFQVGSDTFRLTSGDTIFLPRNIPHTFAQLTALGKMFFLFQPSGKMEDFFRTLGSLSSNPSPEQGAKIFAEHDMQVVGPPLSY
jgi:quercetin 2,3-dioxygenase